MDPVQITNIAVVGGYLLAILAVGIYLPPYIGIGILVGALFRRAAEGRAKRARSESILAAAGLITGGAFLDLILGVLILAVAGFNPEESLKVWGEGARSIPEFVPQVVAGLGILALGLLLYRNSRQPRDHEEQE